MKPVYNERGDLVGYVRPTRQIGIGLPGSKDLFKTGQVTSE